MVSQSTITRGLGAAAILLTGAFTAPPLQAETIHSVTQVSYDSVGRPLCAAVRMNPAAYGTLPSSACDLGTESPTFGPDRITKNTYDDAGQLLQVDQAYGTSVQRAYARYTYTVNGQKWTEKDANGNLTTLEYDGFGRLKKLRYPNTAIGAGTSSTTDYEDYTYDANGNRQTWRRRNGATISYSYDKLNRVTLEDQPAITGVQTATEKDVYTRYDSLGRITWKRFASTSGSGVSYAYDGLGRLESTTDMHGRPLGYLYNAAGARTRLTYPDGNWQPYTLDNLNRLTSSGMGSFNFTLSYDSLGRMTSVSRNNSTSTTYGYDGLGRLSSMTQNLVNTAYNVTWTFNGRNPAGQITSWGATSTVYDYEEIASSTVNTNYDGLNRDTGISVLSGGYDTNGNLANETTPSASDAATKRCMTYDNMNRLLKVAKCSTPTAPDLIMTYDPEGRLAAYTYGSTTTEFLYDGVNLIGEYIHSSATGHASDGMSRRYIHGTGTDQPLLWFIGSGIASGGQFYITNYQGSVIGVSNSAGNVPELYKYGPYGEPKNAQGAKFWDGARFRYTGQYAIKEAELYYYKARVYDPMYGRFLQTDPIGSKDDLNLYGYVKGDPVNGSDPTGLKGECFGKLCNNSAGHTPKSRQAQQDQYDRTHPNMAKGGTLVVAGTVGGGVGVKGSHSRGIAVDTTGKSSGIKTTTVTAGGGANASNGVSVTVEMER
ncbi:RHS Repeat family protein [Asticcacaulis biprosthecium C19]|uniref:RHS Repeat family protein n=1 Tax=Asticcacaulis biprosthecium C19 TaxID=715226 RepID=F4QT30_9CAUL|nr:RHS repeat-associated core domain-containing protein [Asticcacaulis biprosthecium]EGF89900.1 RHS Repeat family protein [Asticcacaulis biprosthecium C19]